MDLKKNTVYIPGLNIYKRHQKRRDEKTPGGIIEFARPLPVLQVMVNLIANGIDACAARAASPSTPVDYRGRVAVSTAVKDDLACLTIRDNGIGMSEETAGRAFEPHFSTKDRGEGTGIGLSSVRMITQDILGGTISLETAPDEGAIFYIEFPVAGGVGEPDVLE